MTEPAAAALSPPDDPLGSPAGPMAAAAGDGPRGGRTGGPGRTGSTPGGGAAGGSTPGGRAAGGAGTDVDARAAEGSSSGPSGEGPPEPRLTVAAVARRLGVAPATLRTWDRRYGLGPSAHAAGAHRRYTGADLRRLDAMRRLTLQGVAPGEAARLALAEPDDAGRTDLGRTPADAPAASARPRSPRAGRRGGGRVLALPSASPASRGLARAAMALDAPAVAAMVRTAVSTTGVVRTWEELLRPVLVAAGRRWQLTGEGVEVEHLLSEVIGGVFRAVAGAASEAPNRRPVLLASAPAEQHALPLAALAAALAEHEVATRLLGPALPETALQAAVRRTGPVAVFVWSQLPANGDPSVLAGLPQTRPAVSVVAGGPGWDRTELPERVSYAEDLGHAVELVRGAVGA